MCGIVGYVGGRPCRDLLLQGLERLEYRGYDSAGLSLLADDRIESVRAVGNLSFLREAVEAKEHEERGAVATATAEPTIGIGHTRWATHGRVCEANAHPHFDTGDRIHIVLNGIVENHVALRERLVAGGAQFTSDTDAEVVAHLIASHYAGDLVEAVRTSYNELRGHYAFVAMAADEPDVLVGARKECPLVVGVADTESFIASAIPAFLSETRTVQYLNDDELVVLRPGSTEFMDASGNPLERDTAEIDWDDRAAEKGGYETFMLKEIYEQADAVEETIGDRVRHGQIALEGLGLSDLEIQNLRRIVILACGTAYHAGVVARYVIEEWARIPVEHDIASEWRYRNPVLTKDTLVIGISQSGETSDTLAALRLARSAGAHTLGITNMMGTQITREVDAVLYTRAGLEMAVAASKTFTAQVALFYLIALKLAQVRRTLPEAEIASRLEEVHGLPTKMAAFL